jgi:hypothetical protein
LRAGDGQPQLLDVVDADQVQRASTKVRCPSGSPSTRAEATTADTNTARRSRNRDNRALVIDPDRPPAFTLLRQSELSDPAHFQDTVNEIAGAGVPSSPVTAAMRDVFQSLGGIILAADASFAKSNDEVVISTGSDSYFLYRT